MTREMCKCESRPSSTVHSSVILVTQKSRLLDVIFCEFQTIHENILFYFCHIQDITDWIQWQYKTCFIIINQHVLHNYHYYYYHHYDHNGTAPDHLSELCRSDAEHTARSWLRSAAHGDLQVPRLKTQLWWYTVVCLQSPGQRQGTDYQQQSGHQTLQNFKKQIKAHFFSWIVFFFSIHLGRGRP